MAGWKLLSVMLLVVFKESISIKTPSSCSLTPVKEGETAVVTCNFGANINETQAGFQVDRYSSMNVKQETLIACQWIRRKLECLLHDNVKFDRHVNNTFQIQILSVSRNDVGKYVCYVLPDPNGISESCYLDINDTKTTSYFMSRSSDLSTLKTSTLEQDANEDAGMNSTNTILTSISFAIIIMQVALIIAGYYIIKRRVERGLQFKHNGTADEEIQECLHSTAALTNGKQ